MRPFVGAAADVVDDAGGAGAEEELTGELCRPALELLQPELVGNLAPVGPAWPVLWFMIKHEDSELSR